MARQLAALPKIQFDMYRTKSRVLGSGDHFESPLTSSKNTKRKMTFDSAGNHITMNISNNGGCKNEEKINVNNVLETEENKVTSAKSAKKKLKKKKKSKAVFLEENPESSNVDISSKNAKDSSQNPKILMTNKLIDPDQSSSRIATMNRTLVADICAVSCFNSQGMNSNETSNKICKKKDGDSNNPNICPKQESKPKTTDENYSHDINDSDNHQSAPPFGFPLSASRLIESAVDLLDSCSGATTSSYEHTGMQNKDNEIYVQQKNDTIGDVRQSTVEINGCVQINCNESNSKIDQITSKKCEPHGETDSVDGDISNLSALEDEGGWQSQVRRSNRKKKKELAARNPRERSQSDHKSKKNFQKDYKTNSVKKQNSKNNTSNRNQSGKCKEILETYTPNNATKDNGNGLYSKRNEEKDRKQEDAKETFSYRDALLKSKPKSSEELQYNSDSGVDVNSVGSCDSAIHSSKTFCEFDLKEAVNFLNKGCNEVRVRHKQGRVHHYSP
ncbi:uncharacterized protein LOC116305751 isoform X2 [Actinia tenebrosa]|nr:uncharacterized protein LOC116305751 isoform X2 [Actinia tenebrosa]